MKINKIEYIGLDKVLSDVKNEFLNFVRENYVFNLNFKSGRFINSDYEIDFQVSFNQRRECPEVEVLKVVLKLVQTQ